MYQTNHVTLIEIKYPIHIIIIIDSIFLLFFISEVLFLKS